MKSIIINYMCACDNSRLTLLMQNGRDLQRLRDLAISANKSHENTEIRPQDSVRNIGSLMALEFQCAWVPALGPRSGAQPAKRLRHFEEGYTRGRNGITTTSLCDTRRRVEIATEKKTPRASDRHRQSGREGIYAFGARDKKLLPCRSNWRKHSGYTSLYYPYQGSHTDQKSHKSRGYWVTHHKRWWTT